MKIDLINVYRVDMTLKSPWITAYGADYSIETILVKMTSGDYHGWGESSPLKSPTYSPEYAAGVFLTITKVLAPMIIGQNINSGRDLQKIINVIKGNYFAKAALDNAWWDLYAKRQGQPLWKVIGGTKNTVDTGDDFGIQDSIDILISKMRKSLNHGSKRIKLKFAPSWGLDMLTVVRDNFPDAMVHIDCNSAFNIDDIAMFKRLDKFNLAMIEQPLASDDLFDHAELQKHMTTPICLDESIVSAHKARKAIEMNSCKWINVKPARVGGITNALEIIGIAEKGGTPCWVGGMLESALGAGFGLALATLGNIKYPSDIFPSDKFYNFDLATPSLVHSAPSQFLVPDTPGVGFEPIPELLEKLTIAQKQISKSL